MSDTCKVLWSEGMFLRPHHFQQQERYVERYIDQRLGHLQDYGWGMQQCRINSELLTLGRLSVEQAQGIFPDGTPFNLDGSSHHQLIREISHDTRQCVVYLGVPLKRSGALEVLPESLNQSLARYQSVEHPVQDAISEQGDTSLVQVGKLKLSLLLETEDRSGFACIAIAKIIERRVDNTLVLDEDFIPTALNANISQRLKAFIDELQGLIHHRAQALSQRLADANRAGVGEISDYLMLQLLNRLQPMVDHFKLLTSLHPERLYTELVQIQGELATFTNPNKRAQQVPQYLHDHLQETFSPLIQILRQQLSTVIEQHAVPLSFVAKKYGIHVCTVQDKSLFEQSSVVLGVKADLPAEQLRIQFPKHVKLGPVEHIRELVNAQMPGIRLTPLPVAPRQIPYHSGTVYFELDQHTEFWSKLKTSGGVALHQGSQFPSLQLEFWAIRH